MFMPIADLWGSLFTWLLHVLTSLIWWVSLASLCMCLTRSIDNLLFVLLPISNMLLDVVFSTYNMVIFTWRPTLTLSMQVIVMMKILFLGTAHLLVGTLSCGGIKNNMLSLSPMPNLNIVLWCVLPLRCFGYVLFFRCFVF